MKTRARLLALCLITGITSTLLLPAAALAATPAPFPTCNLFINPSVIAPGGTTKITWTSTNATGGAITNVGNVAPNGNKQIIPPPAQIVTYVGSFTGPGGTANCQASVQISYGVDGTDVSGGSSGTSGGSLQGGAINPNPVQTTPSGGLAPAAGGSGTIGGGGGSQGPLVQCGTGIFNPGGGQGSATGCEACNLAQLVSGIINFAIGLSIPLAAALFAWAGILYFTSGANPGNKERAKGIFSNALIGFLIAITAWLVINTLLHVLLKQSQFPNQSWFTVQCSTSNRPVSLTFNQVINSILPGVNTAPLSIAPNPVSSGTFDSNFNTAVSSFTPACTGTGYQLTNNEAGVQSCYNVDTGEYQAPTYSANTGTALNNSQMAEQIAAACSQFGMSSSACSLANSISLNESSGGRNCTTSTTGAAGCMQVLATTACGLDSTIYGCGPCLASHNSTSAACQPVIAAVSGNTQLGTNLGVQYINQMYNQYGGNCQLAAAAYFQGPGNVQKYGGVPPNAVSYVNRACR